MLLNSNPVEFRQDSVLMEVNGKQQAIPNDFVWIFTGGEPPTAFLKKIGVGFANRDISTKGSKEAKEARQGVLTPASPARHDPAWAALSAMRSNLQQWQTKSAAAWFQTALDQLACCTLLRIGIRRSAARA